MSEPITQSLSNTFHSWEEKLFDSLRPYAPHTPSNENYHAFTDEALRNFTRLGLAVPQFRIAGIATWSAWGGIGMHGAIESHNNHLERIIDTAFFIGGLIPFYGSFVDLLQAGRLYQKNGWNAEVAIYLGGAIVGFATSVPQFGRVVRMGKVAKEVSSVRIAYLRLLDDIFEAAAKDGKVFEVAKALNFLKGLKQELSPFLTKIPDEKLLTKLDTEFIELFGRYLGNPQLGYKIMRWRYYNAIARFAAEHSQQWVRFAGYAYAPRGMFRLASMHTTPLNPLLGVKIFLEGINPLRTWNYLRIPRPKRALHAFIDTEYPGIIGTQSVFEYAETGKIFLEGVAEKVRQEFGDKALTGGPCMKELSRLIKKLNEGRFPWDISRMRFETTDNQTTLQVARWLMDNYNAVVLANLGRVKSLEGLQNGLNPYRACHIGLVTPTGTLVEVQIMGKKMHRWYLKDHNLYVEKRGLKRLLEQSPKDKKLQGALKKLENGAKKHNQAGFKAFADDGTLNLD